MYNTRQERFRMTKREVPTYWELTTPRKELTKPGTRLFLHLHSVSALFLAVFLPGFPIYFIHMFLGGSIPPDNNWEDSTHYYRYTLISYSENVLFIGAPFYLVQCARLFIRYQKT